MQFSKSLEWFQLNYKMFWDFNKSHTCSLAAGAFLSLTEFQNVDPILKSKLYIQPKFDIQDFTEETLNLWKTLEEKQSKILVLDLVSFTVSEIPIPCMIILDTLYKLHLENVLFLRYTMIFVITSLRTSVCH